MKNNYNDDLLMIKEATQFPGADRTNRNILMQNKVGMRIEFDIDLGELELWPNLKATSSYKAEHRNFSCRDDYTTVFAGIRFPSLNPNEFIKAEYDPFYSTLYFENQRIDILSLFDSQTIIMRFENEEIIDFKSDKQDSLEKRDDVTFATLHPDRGYELSFCANLSSNNSSFRHMINIMKGRTIYARATVAAGDFIVISAAETSENILQLNQKIVKQDFEKLIEETMEKVEQIAKSCKIIVRDNQKLTDMLELNKRIIISAHDTKGAIRAAFKRIYYLIWVRDGGMCAALDAYAGLTEPIGEWTKYLLNNPTKVQGEKHGPDGLMFGQMANPVITKWQEDGAFYAIWSAFTHWTQTGDTTFCSGEYMDVLRASVKWLEEYCFDEKEQLFYRHFYCESPMTNSRDYQWDNACGKPTMHNPSAFNGIEYDICYDIYINSIMHSSYMMLGSMLQEDNSDLSNEYYNKADNLIKNMSQFFNGNLEKLPNYGQMRALDGRRIETNAYGLDVCDYQWALSIAMFLNTPLKLKEIREQLFANVMKETTGIFVSAIGSIITSLDMEFYDEKIIMDGLLHIAENAYRTGKYLVMPNTIVELLDIEDGDIFHDVRPQNFSISAFISGVANLAIKRMPFGFAVRSNKNIEQIKGYDYLNRLIDVKFCGKGEIDKIAIDGVNLKNSWQIPISYLNNDNPVITVNMSENKITNDTLIYSDILLKDVKDKIFTCVAYNHVNMIFKNLDSKIKIMQDNNSIEFSEEVVEINNNRYTTASFDLKGEFTLQLI